MHPAQDLEFFTNGTDFVVARNVEEAKKYLRKHDPELLEEEVEGDGWRQIPRNKVLRWTFKCKEQPHLPVRVIKLIEHYGPGVAVQKQR